MNGYTTSLVQGSYELQSIFPTQFNGHGFLIRDYIRDYTKLQEDLNVHCYGRVLSKLLK